MEKVPSQVNRLRQSFRSGRTLSFSSRRQMLLNVQTMLLCERERMLEALYRDLHKHSTEGQTVELGLLDQEVQHHLDSLSDWMKPHKVGLDLANIPGAAAMHSDPLGVVCIIGAWNFPFQLVLMPLIGCLSAGNCALVKLPDEACSAHSTKLMAEMIPKYLSQDVVQVVAGSIDESKAVLAQKYDLIFFTGGETVGKIVAKSAAEHLTPTILELGGKNPTIIDKTVDIETATSRIAWAAYINAGQLCIRPDYLLLHEEVADKFLSALKQKITTMYSENPEESECLCRLINKRGAERIIKLHEENKKFTFCGGEHNLDKCFMAPTVYDFGTDMEAFSNSSLMAAELFGPLLPVVRYKNIEEVLSFIQDRPKPLAMYCFAQNNALTERLVKETSSGSFTVNDALMFMSNHNLPFGGVGNSGHGGYHGKHSFDAFSHQKSVLYKTKWLDIPQRYPPYTKSKTAVILFLLKPIPRWVFSLLKTAVIVPLIWVALKMLATSGLLHLLIQYFA